MPKYEQVIKKLKKARKESGLKQQIVAEKLGRYQSYLSKVENGDRRIDIIELLELANVYGKDINWFLKKEDSK